MSHNISASGPPASSSAAFAEWVGAIVAAAARFRPASAELSAQRELLRRIDTKYVASGEQAVAVIDAIAAGYQALTVPSGNVARYESLYFDTADRVCYHDHRRGRRIRHKVRIRHYPDRELSFLEVKTKRNERVTDKTRMPLRYGTEVLDASERAFVADRLGAVVAATLQPVMHIEFRRVSLVGVETNERVTLDLAMVARGVDGSAHDFGDLVVIEVKQAGFSQHTAVMRAIHALGLRPQSMSKYTISTALLHHDLPRNRLLPDVRAIERT